MQIRFYNAKIMTMAEGTAWTEGELWVQDRRIVYVGDGTRRPEEVPVWDREIDQKGTFLYLGLRTRIPIRP